MKKLLIISLLAQAYWADVEATYNNLTTTYHAYHSIKNGSSVATVGADSACTFREGSNKIQDAINSPNTYTEIRLANNDNFLENIIITNRDLTIRGGFSTCADANKNLQDINSRTTIEGTAARAVIIIEANNESIRNTVFLENIELIKGRSTPGEYETGGIGTFNANLNLFLTRVDINDSTSSFAGGGINLANFNNTFAKILATDLIIQNNTGATGGGLFCSGPNNSISIEGSSSIAFNSADNGGGGYLQDGCVLNMYSGQKIEDVASQFDGIVSNQAQGWGGGLFVLSGAQANFNSNQRCISSAFGICLMFAGSQSTTTNITSNSSGFGGGGLYITGNNSIVTVNSGLINLNSTVGDGGGVYATDNARFDMFWQVDDADYLYGNCANPNKCSELSGNIGDFGGAIYLTAGAQASLLRTYVHNNQVALANSYGSVAFIDGQNSTLNIEGSVITDNGSAVDSYILRAFNGFNSNINLSILNSTIADNQSNTAVIDNTNSAINISASIISEPNITNILSGTINSTFECVMVNESNSLSGTAQFDVIVDDPEFIDRLNDNYQINASTSPAVDLCDSNLSSSKLDINLENRGFDVIGLINLRGPFDAGADETYDSDIVFKNSFE